MKKSCQNRDFKSDHNFYDRIVNYRILNHKILDSTYYNSTIIARAMRRLGRAPFGSYAALMSSGVSWDGGPGARSVCLLR
jgi:hypothetical protein